MGMNSGAPEVRKSTETSLVSVEALILYVHVYIPVVFAVLNIHRLLYFDTLGKTQQRKLYTRATRTGPNAEGEPMCARGVSSSCVFSETIRFNNCHVQ